MSVKSKIESPNKSFSIIITSFNEGDWLQKTVDSILGEKSYENYEIILINDASTDDSFEFLQSTGYRDLVQSGKISSEKVNGLGVSAGRHAGALKAKNDVLIFLDAHMKVSPGWLKKINDTMTGHKHIKLLGMKIYEIESEPQNSKNVYSSSDLTMVSPCWINLEDAFPGELVKVPFINAANLIIDRKAYFQIGGFPPYIKGWGPEDRSLCLAAYYAGYDSYLHFGIEIGHFYKINTKLSSAQISKMSQIIYSSLAASYVLYPPLFHQKTVRKLKLLFPGENFDSQFNEFSADLPQLSESKSKLKILSKRNFRNFISDHSDFLYFIHRSELEEALTIYPEHPEKALKLINLALKARFFPDQKQKTDFLSACKLLKAYLIQLIDPQTAIELVWEILKTRIDWIPVNYLAAELSYDQKNYPQAIAFYTLTINLLEHKDLYDNNPLISFPTRSLNDLLFRISQCHFYSGNYLPAKEYIEKCLEQEPDRPEFQKALVECHKQIDVNTLQNPANSAEAIFEVIHKHNVWGSKESISGPGSTISATTTIREAIPEIVRNFNINSVLDVPCGDLNWIKHIFTSLPQYTGIDIVSGLIDQNRKNFGSDKINFLHKNLISDQLPQADLILCRDCLPHLTLEQIRLSLMNFVNSKSKYLFTTTFPLNPINRDIQTGQWSILTFKPPPSICPPHF